MASQMLPLFLQKDGDQNNVKTDEALEEHSTTNKVF